MQKGAELGCLYLTLGGGKGDTKDEEKHQRNTGGTSQDEDMWMAQARSEESDGRKMKGEK